LADDRGGVSVCAGGGIAAHGMAPESFFEQSGQIKKKSCSVRHWQMDPVSGASELTFVVPKGLESGPYTLWVMNKVGSTSTTFTID